VPEVVLGVGNNFYESLAKVFFYYLHGCCISEVSCVWGDKNAFGALSYVKGLITLISRQSKPKIKAAIQMNGLKGKL
jgi:hypothetical protein